MASKGRLAAAVRGGAAGAALALAVLAWPGPVRSQGADPSQAKVFLSWRTDWTPTGVRVDPGDTLSIDIQVLQPPRPPGETRAQGQGGSLVDRLAQAAALQAFVGRLDEGPPFRVGRNFRQVMKTGGLLSLRWTVPREAGVAGAFSAAVRVEPGPPDDGGPGDNSVATNGNAGADLGNRADANLSVTTSAPSVVDNRTDGEQANAQDNGAEPANVVITPSQPPQPPMNDSGTDGAIVSAESGPSLGRLAILTPAIAGLLLVLAGAGLALKQRRQRLRVKRTRALLGVSPSLDLGEGACRSDDRPAEGPAAVFATRLDTGAVHWTGGGEDG
ncbi:MAG: hypothetical protein QOJ94_2814 [Sphingomonadales bacterium]|jgi:hypothetical protein|nr:hypothetical protein [Sphingomonadales bacterium]